MAISFFKASSSASNRSAHAFKNTSETSPSFAIQHHGQPSTPSQAAYNRATAGLYGTSSYKKKEPLFNDRHKEKARSTTSRKFKDLIRGVKANLRNLSLNVKTQSIDETLQYRVDIARALHDDRSDEQVKLQHLWTILKKSEDRVKQTVRPARRILKEQSRLEQERRRNERRLRGILGRQPLPDELTDEQEERVTAAFRQSGKIARMPGAEVESRDILKLSPGQWLNDELINFYVKLIEQRSALAIAKRKEAKEATLRLTANAYTDDAQNQRTDDATLVADVKKRWNSVWNVHVFNTFFFEKLEKQGYASVRQWTRKVDVFTKDLILLPINVGQMHWVCAAINFRLLRFEYYDSMHIKPDIGVFDALEEYLRSEYADKKRNEFGELDLSGWQRYISQDSPTQANGHDCGMFATMTIEQLSRRDPWTGPLPKALDAKDIVARSAKRAQFDGAEADQKPVDEIIEEELWNFSQSNMPYLRRRMVYEIATVKLLD